MRKFRLDDKKVLCRNASGSGYSSWWCKRGNIIVYKRWYQGEDAFKKDREWDTEMGRSLGRVISEHDGLENCTGHICCVVPNDTFTHCYVRWIDPADVMEVRYRPRIIPGMFFELGPDPRVPRWPENNSSALALALKIEEGWWSEPEEGKPNVEKRAGCL